ncbi:MAG: ribosome small subunit-dependent GTPase A [Bacteroidota bacterium]|nr:ribosome small subunit-dependent GTPase A [Bacteroidota bacterium]MDP4229601.1 ribosome small subunit-dependent GTPase A [Bacteroidota bacterium]MDP4236321.1 ribosome small subunit-dependent GTPase A [Bacteroidota bacterium]
MSKTSSEDHLFSERIRRSHEDRTRKKVVKHRERHSTKVLADITVGAGLKARVITSEGANFIVMDESGNEVRARSFKSTRSANTNSTLVTVGDEVLFEPAEQDIAVIREVLPRRTKLSRRAHKRRDSFEQVIAANIDILAIVMSAGDPPFQNGILDKYIIAGHEGGLEILIVLNKVDELDSNPRKPFIEEALGYYRSIGYRVIRTSIVTAEGVLELGKIFENKTAVFAGKSGVGKSSLVNSLVGRDVARTKELTRREQRGMHTTTNAALVPIAEHPNSFIVDTPGIREFFHFDLDPDIIKFHFTDFLKLQEDCAMTNCMHIHEPGCAVIEAVDDGLIPEWRHNSYMGLWEEAERERKMKASGI